MNVTNAAQKAFSVSATPSSDIQPAASTKLEPPASRSSASAKELRRDDIKHIIDNVIFLDGKEAQRRQGYTLTCDPGTRISSLELSEKNIADFLRKVEPDFDRDPFHSHKHIPFERFAMAGALSDVLDENFVSDMKSVLTDWERGCLIIKMPEKYSKEKNILAVQTAIGYLIGNTRCDATGSHLAFMNMTNDSKNAPPLINPHNDLSLHTDGTFFGGRTDWLLFAKVHEESSSGGETVLLHVKDWQDYEKFSSDPMASHVYEFMGPQGNDSRRQHLGDRGDSGTQLSSLFFKRDGNDSFRFTYQWVHPKTLTEAMFLRRISDSLKREEDKHTVALPQGSMYLINNNTWLHGRKAFDTEAHLNRKGCRIFGSF